VLTWQVLLGCWHVTTLPPLQLPLPSQTSLEVQALLSLQLVPAFAKGFEQMPVAESQLPAA
jgi:hypothetical protein